MPLRKIGQCIHAQIANGSKRLELVFEVEEDHLIVLVLVLVIATMAGLVRSQKCGACAQSNLR
jgi:hypothetical protein